MFDLIDEVVVGVLAGGIIYGVVNLLFVVIERKPKMQLSEQTQAMLAHAFSMKAEANEQDSDVVEAEGILTMVEHDLVVANENLVKERLEAIEAHRDSNDAALDAIHAVANELGIELPSRDGEPLEE